MGQLAAGLPTKSEAPDLARRICSAWISGFGRMGKRFRTADRAGGEDSLSKAGLKQL